MEIKTLYPKLTKTTIIAVGEEISNVNYGIEQVI